MFNISRVFCVFSLMTIFALPAVAADPTIAFKKQPAPLPGGGGNNMPGTLKFELKWADCENAQKLEVLVYEIPPVVNGMQPPPIRLPNFLLLEPIPGGANNPGLMVTIGGLPSGKQVNFKAKVINNAVPALVIAEETSTTVAVP